MQYLEWFQKNHPELSRFNVELYILRRWEELPQSTEPSGIKDISFGQLWTSWKREKWQHRAACIAEWRPSIDHHPWFLKILQAWDLLEQPNERCAHFLGSQNSGKTEGIACMLLQILLEDPAYTSIFIAGPYKAKTEVGLWASFQAGYHDLCRAAGWDHDKTHYSSQSKINLHLHERAGWVRVVSVGAVGMMQGNKPRNPYRGWLIVAVDEIGVFPNKAQFEFNRLLNNLLSPPRTRLVTACNPRSVHGLDGMLCRPGDGRAFSDLQIESDKEWRTVRRGRAYRFDCNDSPNMGPKGTIFPYLVKREDIEEGLVMHGPKGPGFLEQFRAWFDEAGAESGITSIHKIRMGGAFLQPQYSHATVKRFAFADPSLGGDKYMLMIFEEKTAIEEGTHRRVYSPVFVGHAPIVARKKLDAEDLRYLKSLAPKLNRFAENVDIALGGEFPPEWQGALWVARKLREFQVPSAHCGFDSTNRGSIVVSFQTLVGYDCTVIDFGAAPPDKFKMPSGIGLAEDIYKDFSTFLWHLAAEMLEMGAFREMDKAQAALDQLCKRTWKMAGTKRILQKKEEFIQTNQNQSPDEMDAFGGVAYMAFKLGSVIIQKSSPKGKGLHQWMEDNLKPQTQRLNNR